MRTIAKRPTIWIVVAVMVLLVALIASRRDPSNQNKTVRQLIWEYAKIDQQGFNLPPTAEVKEFGPRAVPLLVTELKRQNPRTHRLQFWAWNKGPEWVRNRMQDPYEVADAFMIRQSAAKTLGSLGPEAKGSLPDLRIALKDEIPHVKLHAAYAMWQIDHTLADEVVPMLLELHTNTYNFKYFTSLYLGSMGEDAKVAIPLLREMLNDSHSNIRWRAKEALEKLEHPNHGLQVSIENER